MARGRITQYASKRDMAMFGIDPVADGGKGSRMSTYQQMCHMNRAELESEPCRCVGCSACGGSGTVWFSFSGRYLGNSSTLR